MVQKQTAEVLQLPVSQISVVPAEIGGGFGGKIPVYLKVFHDLVKDLFLSRFRQIKI